ncbi:MAG TPA: hypothetical protein VGF96_16165 [Terracidiphilus sp.]|jgi:hypothetical protein
MKKPVNTPKALDDFVDKVLRFKPPPKSKAAKKRIALAAKQKKPMKDLKRAAD